MQRKINTFFGKKITIAKWQFNLFGLACFLVGSGGGIYFMLNGGFPRIFAAGNPVSVTKNASSNEFAGGTLVGSRISGSGSSSKVQLGYSNTWSVLADAPFAYNPIGDMLTDNNGNIFVLNGDSGQPTTILWKYNIATSVWSQLTPSPASTDFTSMTYDGNGHIFVLRNRSMNPYPQWTNTAWKYDIATDTWSELPGLPTIIMGGTIVSDKNNTLFVNSGDGGPSLWKYVFPPSGSGTWVQLASPPEATFIQSAAYDNNGHIFYFKGANGQGAAPTNVFWKYDIASDSWSVMANAPVNIDGYSSSLEYDQNGGMYSTGDASGVLWRYDISSNTWSALANAPGTTSALVFDNKNNAKTIYALGTWGQTSFFKTQIANATSGVFETAPIKIDWNAGWADVDSFSANVALPSGTSLKFSIKVASSVDGLTTANYVSLDQGVVNGGIFTANLKDPDGNPSTPDGVLVGDNRYVKVKVEFASNDNTKTPELNSITLNYAKDVTPPNNVDQTSLAMHYLRWSNSTAASEQDVSVQNGDWIGFRSRDYNHDQPYYINWKNAQDPDGGSVVAYCLYLGYDSNADPGGSGGLLSDSNQNANNGYAWSGLPGELVDNTTIVDVNNNPICHLVLKKQDLAGDRTEFDMKKLLFDYSVPRELASDSRPYYLNVKAVDAGGNISSAVSTFSFRIDTRRPNKPAYVSGPGSFISDRSSAIISWPVNNSQVANDLWQSGDNDANGNPISVELSGLEGGVAGYKYCIGDNCSGSGRWFGLKHTGNLDDVIPVSQGSYVMQTNFGNNVMVPVLDVNGNPVLDSNGNPKMETDSDFSSSGLKEGINHVWLRICDKVGNCTTDDNTNMRTDIKINTSAPSAPQNLAVTPINSVTNAYAFSWTAPSRIIGDVKNIQYCYTVNKTPSAASCIFTGSGATSLASDAFATQPGDNTFYIVAKGDGGVINYDDYASVKFSYNGAPPTEPVSVDVADISIKSTADWKLVVSWSAPKNTGAGVSSYKIFRSETATTCSDKPSAFKEVGSTAGTSFADVGLSQKTYYYCVKAYDSANSSLNRYSNTVSKLPNGKFTEPAVLTDGPNSSNVTTSKALISWTTDRKSDSKIAYGEKEGIFFNEEPSNSEQSLTHRIQLNNLSPGTTYFYRAKWTDEDGNTGVSSEKSFKTEPAPTVKNVKAQYVGINSAFINFTTKGASKAKIYYGQSTVFGSAKEISTSTGESDYNFVLDNLNDDTKYYYKINTFDAEGQEYEGTTLDFATLPRPKISNVKFQPIKDSAQPGVEVTWDSNTEISSIVSYAPVDNPTDKRNQVQVDLVSGSHDATIMNLRNLTKYSLVVKGVDKAGNEATSDSYTFTTAADTRPPQISQIVIEGSSSDNQTGKLSQLAVSWNTDEDGTSQVEFGEGVGSQYTQRTQEDSNLTTNHLVIISGLTPSKVYHLRIISKDEAGNVANSLDTVSITPKAVDSAFELVVGNLMSVFGFLKGIGN